ncbi:hypothetical protein DMENIID0001_106400 [Sergentomyia squamirostris]
MEDSTCLRQHRECDVSAIWGPCVCPSPRGAGRHELRVGSKWISSDRSESEMCFSPKWRAFPITLIKLYSSSPKVVSAAMTLGWSVGEGAYEQQASRETLQCIITCENSYLML